MSVSSFFGFWELIDLHAEPIVSPVDDLILETLSLRSRGVGGLTRHTAPSRCLHAGVHAGVHDRVRAS